MPASLSAGEVIIQGRYVTQILQDVLKMSKREIMQTSQGRVEVASISPVLNHPLSISIMPAENSKLPWKAFETKLKLQFMRILSSGIFLTTIIKSMYLFSQLLVSSLCYGLETTKCSNPLVNDYSPKGIIAQLTLNFPFP